MGAYREASGGQAQGKDPVQDLVVQGAVQAHQIDACNMLRTSLLVSSSTRADLKSYTR